MTAGRGARDEAPWRLFIAIELPPDLRRRLEQLARPLLGVRWVGADRIHLTLRFIGNVARERVPTVRDALATVHEAPVSLRVQGAGAFGGGRGKGVLWAGVAPSEPLIALKSAIDDALESAGIPAERRRFHPHVTLARFAPSARAKVRRVVDELQARIDFEFRADAIALVRSRLSASGAAHERILERALGRG